MYTFIWEEGTIKCHTHQKESVENAQDSGFFQPADLRRAGLRRLSRSRTNRSCVAALVNDLIDRVADKWTMLILEVLTARGELRFTRISESVSGISQKMLTQTLRRMERDGLISRTIHPVVPPRVEYKLTHLGLSLGAAFCGVWLWAEQNLDQVEKARREFDLDHSPSPAPSEPRAPASVTTQFPCTL